MKSRERQQIGLKLSPLAAEKLVEFLVTIFSKSQRLESRPLRNMIKPPESPNTSTIRTQRESVEKWTTNSEAHLPLNNLHRCIACS
jgi:hypothetical protein